MYYNFLSPFFALYPVTLSQSHFSMMPSEESFFAWEEHVGFKKFLF